VRYEDIQGPKKRLHYMIFRIKLEVGGGFFLGRKYKERKNKIKKIML